MKRMMVFGMVLMMVLTAACGKSKENMISGEADVVESSENTGQENEKWARRPMVMVDDKLYFDTGKENTKTR